MESEGMDMDISSIPSIPNLFSLGTDESWECIKTALLLID
jgi:hypothetical protein